MNQREGEGGVGWSLILKNAININPHWPEVFFYEPQLFIMQLSNKKNWLSLNRIVSYYFIIRDEKKTTRLFILKS